MATHQRRLYAFIYALVQDRHAADDVSQDVYAILWRRFDTFQEGTSFSAWSYQVARLQVMNWRRKQKRLLLPMAEDVLTGLMDTAAENADKQDERIDALDYCLGRLPGDKRDLLQSRYHFGYSVVEIAEQRNRSRRAVYKALGKIHEALLSCIQTKMKGVDYG